MLKWQPQPAGHPPGLQRLPAAGPHSQQPPAGPRRQQTPQPPAAPARQARPPSESSDAPSASTASAPITVRVPGADDCAGARLPVWLGPRVVWVAGVGRRTTCDDVVAALGASPRDYAIAERWGRVERRLDGGARLLKLWTAWGDAQGQVRLILRHASDVQQAAGGRRRSHHHHHHHHHQHHRQRSQHRGRQEPQPQPQPRGEDADGAAVRRLLRLVLEQGETIAAQLARLGERDRQISSLELRTHRRRLRRLGSNYLLEAYLGPAAAGAGSGSQPAGDRAAAPAAEDSGVVSDTSPPADSPPATHPRLPPDHDHDHDHDADLSDDAASSDDSAVPDDLSERVELLERLVQVNRRLEREESALVRLTLQVRSLQSQQPPPQEPPAAGGGEDPEVRRVLLERLEAAAGQLERGRAELRANEAALAAAEAGLAERRRRLRALERQLGLPAPAPAPALDSSLDSNSDTGLSSLHSGSEEADALCPPPPPPANQQPLDTLV